MAQGDGTAARVQAVGVGAQFFLPGQGHRGEGFVDLVMVDVSQLQTGLGQHALGGRDGGGEHVQRVIPHHVECDEACARAQAQLLRTLFAHDQHCAGAVGHLRGIAGRGAPLDLRKARRQLPLLAE